MGKLIIMSSNAQVTASGEAALTPNTLRDLAVTIDIFRSLGGVVALEATTKSHTEQLEQLTQWVSAIPHLEEDVARNTKDLNEIGKRQDKRLNELEKAQTKDLNELGIRIGKEITDLKNKDIGDLKNLAHTAKILGYIALTLAGVIGAAFVTYLFRK